MSSMLPEFQVSVILPVYNGAMHLRTALRSVFAQQAPPAQLVIIDDGSADDSRAVVRTVLEEFKPSFDVVVIEQENQGQSAARNAGAELATGELLAFLDQDDLWHPRHLELLTAPFATDSELGWSYSDFNEIDDAGQVVTRDFIRHHQLVHPKKALGQLLGADNMVLPSASVIHGGAFAMVGGFDPRLRGYEDDDLFIRIFRAGWTSSFVDESLTSYRVHGGGSSANGSFRRSRMVFFEKLTAAFPDDPVRQRYYVSDLIVPRLVATTVSEYATAVRNRRFDEARSIADSIATMLAARERSRGRHRFAVAMMRRPRMLRAALRLRRALPRSLRSRIGPAALVRD